MKRLTAILASAALVFTITSCSGSASNTSASADREAKTTDCPPVSGDHDENATFSWIYSVDNSSFDKDHITTNNSLMYLFPIYDSLVHVDASGEPQPMLAKSWEISEDGSQLTMDLIDWKFHDGTPFDADAVVANIKRSQEPGSFNVNALSAVTDVEAVDKDTVRFTTKDAAGALVNILGGSAGMMMSPAVMDDKSQDVKPTGGSGAYEMTKYVSGSRVEYTAVPDYWDPDAQNVAKMVFFISGDDNARLNAVTTGSADSTFLRASMYDPAVKSGLTVCEQPSLSSYNLNLNTKRSEFAKPEVRAAVNHAIDRTAIAAVTDGFCEPGVQMFPTWYFAASKDLTADSDEFAYDPEQARQLLKDAGLEDGFSFDLEVVNLDLYQQIAEVIQANLAEVGIDMSITPVELDALGEHFSVNKTADAILFEQKAESDPSIQMSSYYEPSGFNNPGGWGTDEISQLNEDAMAGTSTEERSAVYDELNKAVAEEVGPTVTLCHLTTPFVLDSKVMGVEIYADGARNFRGVAMKP